jgi:hypothetical protein
MTKPIFNISWVTPESFDINRLSIKKGKDRYRFVYKYKDDKDPSEFRLTIPRTEDAYVCVSELSTNIYKGVSTGRNKCNIRLNLENSYHYNIVATIEACKEKFKEKFDQEIKSSALLINSEQLAFLYCSIIENEEEIFTPFYTEDKQLDTLTTGQFLGRPALMLYVTERNNLKVCISQAYVYKLVPNFPLAWRD